ncbi:hypothetical protein [Kitasatospora xanthocidica]|uniref:hypothetical protein n=1 Tax=Kitasatospora xanthocidica TaxID=83382 RepID=UPI0015F33CF3|nr:hypothetical protein [Kitasatospora xanthocidica]
MAVSAAVVSRSIRAPTVRWHSPVSVWPHRQFSVITAMPGSVSLTARMARTIRLSYATAPAARSSRRGLLANTFTERMPTAAKSRTACGISGTVMVDSRTALHPTTQRRYRCVGICRVDFLCAARRSAGRVR